MRKRQLEDLLGEVARVSGGRDVVIIGSQCVHAVTEDAPAEVVISLECDLVIDDAEVAERLEAELGAVSAYRSAHGVYVDVVSASFPFLPDGWPR